MKYLPVPLLILNPSPQDALKGLDAKEIISAYIPLVDDIVILGHEDPVLERKTLLVPTSFTVKYTSPSDSMHRG